MKQVSQPGVAEYINHNVDSKVLLRGQHGPAASNLDEHLTSHPSKE